MEKLNKIINWFKTRQVRKLKNQGAFTDLKNVVLQDDFTKFRTDKKSIAKSLRTYDKS